MQGTWHPQWPLRTVSSWTQSSSHIHIEFRKKQKFKVLYPFFNFEILSRFLPEYQTWNIHTIVSEPPTHWIFMLNITKAEITKPYVGFFFSFCHWFFFLWASRYTFKINKMSSSFHDTFWGKSLLNSPGSDPLQEPPKDSNYKPAPHTCYEELLVTDNDNCSPWL